MVSRAGSFVRLGGGLAAAAVAFGSVLVPAGAAWAKGSTVLKARETRVRAGQPVHFSGEIGDDGGITGFRACLYEVLAGGRYQPLHRCAKLVPSPGEAPSFPSHGSFAMTAPAGAAGRHSFVVAVERDGKVDVEPSSEPIGHSAPVVVTVIGGKQPGRPPTPSSPSARPSAPETTSPSAPPGSPGPSAQPGFHNAAATRDGRSWWLAAGAVPVVAILAGAAWWRRRRQ